MTDRKESNDFSSLKEKVRLITFYHLTKSRSITTGVGEQSFLEFNLLDIAKSFTNLDAHPRVNNSLN